MATVTATTPTSLVARPSFLHNGGITVSASPVLGLPAMAKKGRVRCSSVEEKASPIISGGMGASSMMAAVACAATMSSPALALVDERMSTEGTGLSLGISNNFLGWILLGVFALIWALFFVYTSTLEEDEESGLSL